MLYRVQIEIVLDATDPLDAVRVAKRTIANPDYQTEYTVTEIKETSYGYVFPHDKTVKIYDQERD